MPRNPHLTCTLISCAQRDRARALTIPQLLEHNLEPRVFLSPCQPAGRDENARVGLRALEHAAETGRPTLFTEDDIDLAEDFSVFLDMALASEEVVYLYLNDRPDRVNRVYGPPLWREIDSGEPMHRQLVRSKVWFGLYGSQCVLMPPDAVQQAVVVARRQETATDTALIKAWAENKRWPLIALPHPVQHRYVRTAREKDTQRFPKKSRSFDLPRLE